MELKQLKILLTIVDHGGFTSAADVLGTVQSNISSHIAKLERELGVTLINRDLIALTQEGEIVAARAQRIMNEIDALHSDLAAFTKEVSGTVKVGIIGTTARWVVPELMETINKYYPKIKLVIIEGTSTVLESYLLVGQVDFAILDLPISNKELTTVEFFEEDLCLAIPVDNPLSNRESVELSELSDLPLLLPLRNTGYRHEIDLATKKTGVKLHPKLEVDGVRLIASLAFAGYGPAILPITGLPPIISDRWRLIKVNMLPRRVVGIVYQKRELPSAATRTVVEVLQDAVHRPNVLPSGLYLCHPSR